MVMIKKELLYELPEPLTKPFLVNSFFTDELFERVKQHVYATGIGTEQIEYHPFFARWEISALVFDEDIESFCLNRARELYKDNSLVKAYFFAVRYQIKDGCIPHLWKHYDQNGTQTTIDIIIDNSAEWPIFVEGKTFEQGENDAVLFCGQQHVHSRPPFPTRDESKYTTALFLHFTQPEHWIQKDKTQIQIYGPDGNIRFFNKFRYLPLPDNPVNQPVCKCHDYSGMMDLYRLIFGDEIDSESETVDMSIIDKKLFAPGIVVYSLSAESAQTLCGLAQNACFKQWEPALVLKQNSEIVDINSRSCFLYGINAMQDTCHPQDPLTRLKRSLESGLDDVIEQYRAEYSIEPLESRSTQILRYEHNGMFVKHIDDCVKYPRVVSVSLILNDDYEGGEIEFPHFGLTIRPNAGQIVVFPSSYPYLHCVNPVLFGNRMAAVRWYQFKKEPLK